MQHVPDINLLTIRGLLNHHEQSGHPLDLHRGQRACLVEFMMQCVPSTQGLQCIQC